MEMVRRKFGTVALTIEIARLKIIRIKLDTLLYGTFVYGLLSKTPMTSRIMHD